MFSEPHWLLLIVPLLILTVLMRPESKKIFILRILLIIVAVLALAKPILKIPGREGTVIVVADRSSSMPINTDNRISETLDFLRSKMPSNGRLGLVTFADKGKIEFSPTKNDYSALSVETNADASNLSDGIGLALSLIPNEMAGRIVLISDGLWNGENPMRNAQTALNRGVPIDYRYYGRKKSADLAVSYLRVPPILEPKEPFIIKAGIFSPSSQKVKLELLRNEKSLLIANRELKAGLNEFSFSLVAPTDSILKYILKVIGSESDEILENNVAQAVSMVKGKKPILVVTDAKPSTVKRFLDNSGIKAREVFPQEFSWSIEDLAGVSAVVLDNVSANSLGFGGLHNLSAWVKHIGGGLLVTGGKNSYGTGGYYQSPLDAALPVSMEMRNECRKMSIALAVVLDRSGSMTAQVNGRTKMELANLAAASTLDLLSAKDEFALFAVDTKPHTVVPLQSVSSKQSWYDNILRVQSEGGGIFVYDGIKAAVDTLKTAKAQTRHIILFADACDSEKPGEYWELLEDAEKNGISLSVIGLGKETDNDADLLRKIAECGRGRCFFTAEAEDLPRLFSQDTFMAVKSSFAEEKCSIVSNSSLKNYTGYNSKLKSALNGYNICYLRSQGTQLITAENDEKSPVLAVWQYGLGRVGCFTGVLDNHWGMDFVKTTAAPRIFYGLMSWLAFDDRESLREMAVTQKIRDGIWSATIYLDPERIKEPFEKTPEFNILVSNGNGEPKSLTLKTVWDNGDQLSASYRIKGKEIISPLLCVNKNNYFRLAPACQIYSPEFLPQTEKNGENELKKIAKITSGGELIDLGSVWESMPTVYQKRDVSNYLLILAMIIFLLEIAERRMAFLSAIIAKIKSFKPRSSLEIQPKENMEEKTSSILKTNNASISEKANRQTGEMAGAESKKKNILSALKTAREKAEHRTVKD